MKSTLRICINLSLLMWVFSLYGCLGSLPMVSQKPSQADYQPVEYQKLTSGLFVDELANGYVKVDCTYALLGAGMLPGGYSRARYAAFRVLGPKFPQGASQGMLTVVIPKHLSDTLFSFNQGDQITVYGRAVPAVARTVVGKSYRDLIIQADLIQKKQ